jgi:hypothetical protein
VAVINISLRQLAASNFLCDGVSYAVGKNVPVVAAMGNDGGYVDAYPAKCSGATAVGATTISGNRASYSNVGGYIDLVAPGTGIVSTYRDPFYIGYVSENGTSMAAPHVTGVYGLMISIKPGYYSPQKLESILKQTADYVGCPDTNCYESGTKWNSYYGAGLLNAYQAVLEASKFPKISVDPTSYDYGIAGVGSKSMETFSIKNVGNRDLTLGTISLAGTNAIDFITQSDNCSGKTLASSSSCSLQVGFAPTSAGPKSANLRITSNDPDTPALNVALSGTGAGVPDISVTPTYYNFGSIYVGSTSPLQTFTISNIGSTNLIFGTISITGVDASQFNKQNDTCSGETLAPSNNCTVQVVFSPTSTGSKSSTLSIPSNDPDTPALNVSLSGTGVGSWLATINFVWDKEVKAFNIDVSPEKAGTSFSPGTNLKFKVRFTVDGDSSKLYRVKLMLGKMILLYLPTSDPNRVIDLKDPDGNNFDVKRNIVPGEAKTVKLVGQVPPDAPIGGQFRFKGTVKLFEMGDTTVLDEQIVSRTFNIVK